MKRILLALFILGNVYSFGQNNAPCSNCLNGASYGPHNPNNSPPNGNSTLGGPTYLLQKICGLNYVQATVLTETRSKTYGFNTNGTGFPTTVTISGLPNGFIAKQAYVYYGGSYTEPTPPATSVSITNPAAQNNTISSTMIGTGVDVCWGTTGTCGYRCDVTSMISGNGTYTINLTGFNNAAYEMDGVTLFIAYVDTSATYTGSIVLWDGNMANNTGSPMNYTGTGFTSCAGSSLASAFSLFGDIQSNVSGNQNTDNFNGSISTFPNNFWQCNVINTTVTPCQTSCIFKSYTNNSNDCWLWTMAGLYWQYSSCSACQGGHLNVAVTDVDPTCGGSNGKINIAVSGGSPPYTYSWNPNVSNVDSATGLSAGSYTISISDGACPPDDTTIVVTLVAQSMNFSASVTSNILCNGSCTGSAKSVVSGGSSPYNYLWAPSGGINANATGLCAGNYTVSVQDKNGCTATATVTITQPPALVPNLAVTNIPCFGGTGTAGVAPTGGTPGYVYSWSAPGGTNASLTGLSAGSYTITITDANGCTTTLKASITQPAKLTASISASAPPLCNGGTGTATVAATGGTPAYTYAWSPAGGSNATGTGLSANTPYTVTVTDANGCTASASITLTQPAGMTLTMGAPTYPLCNGGTGTASITVTGGTPNYTYAWNPSGQTTANATGLTSAIYTVTVTDAQGCSLSDSVDITQPSAISIITGLTPASCNLPNGGASATVSGGVGPYAYVWTPIGQTTAAATGISAGTYTVTVTDHNHCTASAPVTITQPSAVVASINGVTPDLCNGGHEGTATATATGGTSPYNYLWSPGGNTNAAGTGLGAGTYTMTITDASGCSSTASATVTQPPALVVNVSGPFTLCTGAKGLLTASVSGGTAPYIYSWTGLNNATSDTVSITPVISQTYTVNITDANGCTTQGYFTVNLGPALSISLAKNVSICKGTSTTLCVTPFGGTGGNVYNWQPGNFTTPCITISPTSTTIYTVSVSDNCGAIATASSIVVVGSPPDVGFSADLYQGCAPLCIQFRDASTFFQGGAKHFIWQFGNGDTLQSQNPIYCYKDSGTFSVTLTVSSDSGCSATLNKINLIRVYQHPTAAFSISPQPATILAPTIQFTDKSFGPADIEYWRWNFGDESDTISKLQNPEHTYRDTGTYCANLIIMDAHGCTDTTTNCLVIEPAFNLYIPSAFSPNGDGINDVFQPIGQYIQSFDMYIFDRWGMELYHTTDINKGWNGTVNGGSTIAQEDTYIYKITVTDSQGNQHSYVGNVTLIK